MECRELDGGAALYNPSSSVTGRLDDLDAQLGEIKDILIYVISLLEPNEDNQ